MTLILSAHSLSKSHGSQNLFTDISFSLYEGDRMGLVGPNGAGKSTLLKVLVGIEDVDSGKIAKKQGVRIAYASQSPEFSDESVKQIMLSANKVLSEEEASVKAQILLHKAGFTDDTQAASSLSGGWKKRLDIIRALMQDPDLILLDEPTNHLDLEGIAWLEKFLQRERFSYFIVSHDRHFLDVICTKVIELNRSFPKGVFACDGNFSTFTERREGFLQAQLEEERSLASTVRDEVDWMRRSPKARTTKSKSRMERAEDAIQDLQELTQRNQTSKVGVDFVASERETRNLIVCNNLGKSLGGKVLFKGVDFKLSPRSRLGIVGKNGTGKTTLLKILSGEITPDIGTVKYAQDLKLVYFDQHRETLDPDITLREALSPGGDFVKFQGQLIHVNGWAKKFLFFPDRLNLPVRCLSGGERARILLARLMLKPADVLFLDEPTNDLDIATLEVIENSLLEFAGAVVLISHDRFLMDRVCTQILGLGQEREQGLFADLAQWEEASRDLEKKKEKEEKASTVSNRPKKLSYKEQKELEGMESAILIAEEKLHTLQKKIEENLDPKEALITYEHLGAAQVSLDSLYERWQVLLDKVSQSS